MDEYEIKVENTITIQNLKEIIKEISTFKKNDDITSNNIRLFFGGKELKDKEEIWTYNVGDDSIIIMM